METFMLKPLFQHHLKSVNLECFFKYVSFLPVLHWMEMVYIHIWLINSTCFSTFCSKLQELGGRQISLVITQPLIVFPQQSVV